LIGIATLLLDQAGRVLSLNHRAEALLNKADRLRTQNRRLVTVLPSEQSALDACVAEACAFGSGRSTEAGSGAVVLHSMTGAPLFVSVLPYRSGWKLEREVPATLVFLTTPEESPSGEQQLWKAMFGLTPAECRVAEMMRQSADVPEIAAAMRVRPDTVRYYQKCVYRKTGMRGHSELLQLLSRLPLART
jgi:DNA-binding CsgD family transcriptional regulator